LKNRDCVVQGGFSVMRMCVPSVAVAI